MSSAVLAVGMPTSKGFLSTVGSALPRAITDLGGAANDVEDSIFSGCDSAIENKLGQGITSELVTRLPRMAWRVLTTIGTAAAMGLSLL